MPEERDTEGAGGRRKAFNPLSREDAAAPPQAREKPGGALLPLPGAVPAPQLPRLADRVGGPGARACGLFKSWGRAGPGRAGAAAGGGGGGVRGARAAPAPRRAQPCAAPPAARTARRGTARLRSARPAQPPRDPREPPRLGPRWSPLPRSGGKPRVGAAAGGRPAAEVRGGGGRGAARPGSAQFGTNRRGLPGRRVLGAAVPELRGWVSPDPLHDNYFGSFYPAARRGWALPVRAEWARTDPPGRSGPGSFWPTFWEIAGPTARLFGVENGGAPRKRRRRYAELQQGDA